MKKPWLCPNCNSNNWKIRPKDYFRPTAINAHCPECKTDFRITDRMIEEYSESCKPLRTDKVPQLS